MSKRMGDPGKKEYGYNAGFMGLEVNDKNKEKEEEGNKLKVLSTKVMTGNELEEFLEQYGQQFPITVGFHDVEFNPETQEMSYTDFYGVKRTTSKEKARAYHDKQERQGTIKQKETKKRDKTEGIR